MKTYVVGTHLICPDLLLLLLQSFGELTQRPLIVDLTVEEGQRLKVLYGTRVGFHAIDVDTASIFDLYIPQHVSCHSVLDVRKDIPYLPKVLGHFTPYHTYTKI